jgi:HSP20 family protein
MKEDVMSIIRWDPFQQMNRLQDRVNRLFNESVYRPSEENDFYGIWSPPVDIYETDNELVLKAELPGIKPENVDIRIENNTLSLKGERKFEEESKKDNFHRMERSYGTFIRSFTLPRTVEQDKVVAEYKDGVLSVTLPKKEETKIKQISIKVNK